ncbi:sensor histidine kinase [Paenibacillus piri]|uniref:Heme sensor protein HssS n=1 Tax=Paenibacillus piri TaxID=2547395 RepID=A0A4R5KW83_9BACL|nr:HAMP domain-containing sensor histidine kinase [Paenibacillus piri]TDF99428.1 sensor histidine kinase [Paenibacillus piri]
MRTLYTRIVITFILIALVSGLSALLLSNIYLGKIRENNEQKVLNISNEIRLLYEKVPDLALDVYLSHISNMGFQIYTVNDRMEETFYGSPFKNREIDVKQIRGVLEGEVYHGMVEAQHWLTVNGFFENSIRNSVGVPLKIKGADYALFVRPNLEQQIGDVRVLLGILLVITFLVSIVLIAVSTQFIVKPLKKLTKATKKIVEGDYNIEIDLARQDELGNLARHFTFMAQSIKQLDEMRQQFVANVSHEIQSPLTSIQGFAQAILEKEATPVQSERYLHIIEEESRRLSSLSKQLLTLATLDKENNVMNPSAFRLDEQLRQILIVSEWQWAEKQLSIELDLEQTVITADQQLLYQVWFNFITNSIKFTPSGGTISLKLAVKDDVVVEVSDTGIGIPESDLPRIFERFYKVDRARDRTRSGSGLGLSIAKKIVELHHGSINVQSESGKGTSVTVHLPFL